MTLASRVKAREPTAVRVPWLSNRAMTPEQVNLFWTPEIKVNVFSAPSLR